jgi:hypothetical protein
MAVGSERPPSSALAKAVAKSFSDFSKRAWMLFYGSVVRVRI